MDSAKVGLNLQRLAALAAALVTMLALAASARADVEITVDTTEDTLAGTCIGNGGTCSLRKAISLLDDGELSGRVRIEVVAEGTIEMALGEFVVEPDPAVESVRIAGAGRAALTIDGQEASRIFDLRGGEVTIAGLTLAHGRAAGFTAGTDGGGALHQEAGTVTLEDVLLTGNQVGSGRQGGAIDLRGGDLSIVDSTIETSKTGGGASGGDGGAIYMATAGSDELRIEGSDISGNEADGSGGAIYQDEGSLLIDGSAIEANVATDGGGAVLADASGAAATTIEDSRLAGNVAQGSGGAVFSRNGPGGVTVQRSLVSENVAGESGGGLRVEGPTTIEQSTISDNSSASGVVNDGGGIQAEAGLLQIVNSTIAGNLGGGGLAVHQAEAVVEGSTIAYNENSDESAGGIVAAADGAVTVTSSILAGNLGEDEAAGDCAGESFTSGGHNLLETVSTGCEWTQASGDQVGVDAMLGPLADNGGPWKTVAPAERTSPAINHGDEPSLEDGRGFPRPVPAGVLSSDVGAVEIQAPAVAPGEPPSISPATGLTAGETLICEPGGWNVDGIADPTYAFAWEADGEPAGAGNTYELSAADAGAAITCTVSVDNGATATSAQSAAVELMPANAVLSPPELRFGQRDVGAGPSAAQALTLTNEGGVELSIQGIASGDPAQFPLDASACPASLAPGARCTLTAAFDPAGAGAQSTTVTVASDGGTATAQLSGSGAQPQLAIEAGRPGKPLRATAEGGVPLRLRCDSPGGTPCQTTLELSAARGGGKPAAWSGTIAAEGAQRVTLALGAKARAALGRSGSLKLLASTAVANGGGTVQRLVVHLPPPPALVVTAARRQANQLLLTVACRTGALRCEASISISPHPDGQAVAHGNVSVGAGRHLVRLPLTRSGRELFAAAARLRLRASARTWDRPFHRTTRRSTNLVAGPAAG